MRFTAEQSAELATLAYKRPGENEQKYRAKLTERMSDFGLRDAKAQQIKGAESVTGFHDDDDLGTALVILYRGTDSLWDFIVDGAFRSSPDPVIPNASEHRGFKGHLGLLNKLNEPAFEQAEREGVKQVWVFGHSMGGALAVISAARLWHDKGVDGVWNADGLEPHVVTFGCPRTIGRSFKEAITDASGGRYYPHWRFENRADIVPKMPPPVIKVHAASTLFFGDDGMEAAPSRATRLITGTIACGRVIPRMLLCLGNKLPIVRIASRWIESKCGGKEGGPVSDHLMGAYEPVIKRAERDIEGNLLEAYKAVAMRSD